MSQSNKMDGTRYGVYAFAFFLMVVAALFALKLSNQKGKADIPPTRHYSALQLEGFLFTKDVLG